MSQKNPINLLAKLIWQKKVNKERPFVLLLGAGASITSGGSSLEQIIHKVTRDYGNLTPDAPQDEKSEVFYNIIGGMSDENRCSLLKDFFYGKIPSPGYKYLARLIQEGYFKIIFTTNYDTYLEDALYDQKLRTCDFQTLVCGKDQAESILRLMKQPTPLVKIVKLHGDFNAHKIALLPEEIFQFIESLNPFLTEYLNQNLIIVGHSMFDNDINRTITAEGGELWYINPQAPSTDSFIGKAFRIRKSQIISGETGYFDNFFEALYLRIEELSKHQKVTMNATQYETSDFENRVFDIEFLSNPTQPRFIGIDAPAGYGKSYLLQEIQRRMRDTDWFCPLIDVGQNAPAQYEPEVFLKEIGQQCFKTPIQGSQTEEIEKEVFKLFIKASKKQRVLLLIDSVNLFQTSMHTWVREHFIPCLDASLTNYDIRLRIIIAGRYLAADWARTAYPFHIRQLDPFDESIIREMIRKFAQRFVGQKLRPQRVEDIAREIYQISGGHPKSIRSILEALVEDSFLTDFTHETRVRLFNTHVAYIIDEILQGIPAKIQKCLQILSIFRKFNTDTLDTLISEKEITGFGDGLELLPMISGTRLINPPTANEPMFSDRIVRRILNAKMKYNNPEHFERLHRFAELLYDQWIRSQDIQQKTLPTPVTDQWQLIFIVESLYHSLQATSLDSQEQIFAPIIEKFKLNLKEIKSAFPGNLPNLGIQLKDALMHDLEIINYLKYGFAENAFETLLDVIQTYIDNKGVIA